MSSVFSAFRSVLETAATIQQYAAVASELLGATHPAAFALGGFAMFVQQREQPGVRQQGGDCRTGAGVERAGP